MSRSPLQAIKQKCTECIYDPNGGCGSRIEQIENCTATSCALYSFRPITSAKKREISADKVKLMSDVELAVYNDNKARLSARAKNNFGHKT